MSTIKPNIFIAGASGTGKSTSLRNLDPEKTIIINTEEKQLPFRGAGKFKKSVVVGSYMAYLSVIKKALANTDADVIVIDSFTSLQEQVLMYCKSAYKGFDVWNEYATAIYGILKQAKASNKYVVFMGLGEPLQDENGITKWSVKVDGKAMKGAVEKEFTIVLWTSVDMQKPMNERYQLRTNTDGQNTAKSPMEMFDLELIPNDLNAVVSAANEYYEF